MDELAAPRLTPDDKLEVAELRKATKAATWYIPHYGFWNDLQILLDSW